MSNLTGHLKSALAPFPSKADAPQQIGAVKARILLSVLDLRTNAEMFPAKAWAGDVGGLAEALLYGISVAEAAGCHREIGIAAARAAWADAGRRIEQFKRALRRRLWSPIANRADGRRLMIEGEHVLAELKLYLPTDVLRAEIRRIAVEVIFEAAILVDQYGRTVDELERADG